MASNRLQWALGTFLQNGSVGVGIQAAMTLVCHNQGTAVRAMHIRVLFGHVCGCGGADPGDTGCALTDMCAAGSTNASRHVWQIKRLLKWFSAVQILETQAALARAQAEEEAAARAAASNPAEARRWNGLRTIVEARSMLKVLFRVATAHKAQVNLLWLYFGVTNLPIFALHFYLYLRLL